MYPISYEMAVELVRHLYETTYGIRQVKDQEPENIQRLFDLHIQLQDLLKQLEQDGHDVRNLKQEIQEHIKRKYDYRELVLKVDGGIRDIDDKSIPSKGACGFKLFGDGELLVQNTYYLGDLITLPSLPDEKEAPPEMRITVNIAEYMAVIKALDYLLTFNPSAERIIVKSDSEVIVNQSNMLVATRVENLIRLRHAVHQRMKRLGFVELIKISRDENSDVDALVNQCLDKIEEQEKEL